MKKLFLFLTAALVSTGMWAADETISWSGSSFTGTSSTNITAGTATAVDGTTYKAGTISINSSKIQTESKKHQTDSYYEDFSNSAQQQEGGVSATGTARIEFPFTIAEGYTYTISDIGYKMEQGGGGGPAVHAFIVQGSTATWLNYTTANTIALTGKSIALNAGSAKLVFVLGLTGNLNNGRQFKFSNISITGTVESTTPAATYDATFSSAKGTAPSKAEGVSSVTLAEIKGVPGWKNTHWTADVATKVGTTDKAAGATLNNGETVTLLGNTTFTAQWAETYTVTLNLDGGLYASTPDGWTLSEGNYTKTVVAGALAIPEPTKSSYSFNGWKSGTVDVELSNEGKLTVSKDTTLTAQWVAPKTDPTATFSNGAYVVGASALDLSTLWSSNSDGTVTYALKVASEDASVTNGAFSATKAGSYVVTASQAATSTYNAIEKEATITVTWAATGTANLSYALSGSTVTGTATGVTSISSLSTSLTLSTLTLSGTKDGYSGAIKGCASTAVDEDIYVDLQFTVANGYVFTPSAVSVKANPFNATGALKAVVKVMDETTTVASNELACAKNTDNQAEFASGAFTNKLFEGTVHIRMYFYGAASDKAFYLKSPITIAGTVAVAPTKYNVTFDKNGGSGEDMPTLKYVEGAEVTLPACTFTAPTGKEFDAWACADSTITGGKFTMPAKDVEVYPLWRDELVRYTVAYYDGSTKLGEEEVVDGNLPVDYATYQTKTLHTFVAWYNNSDLAEEHKIADISALTVTKDTTVYGKWASADVSLTALTYQLGEASPVAISIVANQTEYNVTLPYKTSIIPTVAATANTKASMGAITQAASTTGTATFTVTAEDGKTKANYSINFSIAAKDGMSIFKAELTSATSATYSGKYVDSENSEINLANQSGYKFAVDGNYIKFALAGSEFATGDVLKMTYSTNPQQGELAIYEGTTKLASTAYSNHTLTFPAAANGKDVLYIRRTSDNNFNGWVSIVEVTRSCPKPILDSISLAGVMINSFTEKAASVTLPKGTTLNTMTVVAHFTSNDPSQTSGAVISNEGAWIEGANTYRITDKDGDYDDYSITVAITGTSLDNTADEIKAVKFFENGQLFIRRGEKVYTITGELVK